jgi:SAM-dependent methyltransferase
MWAHDLRNSLFPGERPHLAGLHDELEQRLPSTGAILDLGCGRNTFLAPFRSSRRAVWGTDFQAHSDLAHHEWFRRLHPNGCIPFADATFSLVTALFVLEHVCQPADFFGEVARVLRPGGYFVGHTISSRHYVTWIRRLLDFLPHAAIQELVHRLYGRRHEDTFPTCYRANSERDLHKACRASGLELRRIRRFADPCYFQFWQPAHILAVTLDWLLEKVGAGCGRLYFTVTLQKPDASLCLGTRPVAA